MRSPKFVLAASIALTCSGFTSAAIAQVPARTGALGTKGTVAAPTPGTTGNDRNIVIAPGATGASTIQSDSAAAGNAGHPSRRVPQGSGGGGGGR